MWMMEGQSSRECTAFGDPTHPDRDRYPCVVPTEDDEELRVWMSWTWQRRGIMTAKVVFRDE